MKKLSPKTEEVVVMVVAFFVLGSSMLNTTISAAIAIISLAAFGGYNYIVNKKA